FPDRRARRPVDRPCGGVRCAYRSSLDARPVRCRRHFPPSAAVSRQRRRDPRCCAGRRRLRPAHEGGVGMKRTFVLFCVLAGGCKEDVQLLPPMSIDGSSFDGSGMGGDGPDASVMCVATGGTCDVDKPCCMSRCTTMLKCEGSCLADGMQCTNSQECCGLDCNGNVCRPPAACLALNASCTTDTQCCCGICLNQVCVRTCRAVSETCTEDARCCTGNCTNGFCQAVIPTCHVL